MFIHKVRHSVLFQMNWATRHFLSGHKQYKNVLIHLITHSWMNVQVKQTCSHLMVSVRGKPLRRRGVHKLHKVPFQHDARKHDGFHPRPSLCAGE
jgi:hypothetical protein